ncbi:hypothetical protein QG516_02030 [Pedobacter gandavensis]|nr:MULTISPECIES: hypothetical protein [Pedobacter]WGQ10432.1 hypothetical protein QG516_02030 [Pedobacter gandavensis]
MNLKYYHSTLSTTHPFLAAITGLYIFNPLYYLKNRFKNIIKAPV